MFDFSDVIIDDYGMPADVPVLGLFCLQWYNWHAGELMWPVKNGRRIKGEVIILAPEQYLGRSATVTFFIDDRYDIDTKFKRQMRILLESIAAASKQSECKLKFNAIQEFAAMIDKKIIIGITAKEENKTSGRTYTTVRIICPQMPQYESTCKELLKQVDAAHARIENALRINQERRARFAKQDAPIVPAAAAPIAAPQAAPGVAVQAAAQPAVGWGAPTQPTSPAAPNWGAPVQPAVQTPAQPVAQPAWPVQPSPAAPQPQPNSTPLPAAQQVQQQPAPASNWGTPTQPAVPWPGEVRSTWRTA